jgi:hypothetical protein
LWLLCAIITYKIMYDMVVWYHEVLYFYKNNRRMMMNINSY